MTVLTQDLFYSTFFSTWFSNVDNRNNFDDRTGPCSLTRDVERADGPAVPVCATLVTQVGWTGRRSLMNVRCRLFQGSVSEHG